MQGRTFPFITGNFGMTLLSSPSWEVETRFLFRDVVQKGGLCTFCRFDIRWMCFNAISRSSGRILAGFGKTAWTGGVNVALIGIRARSHRNDDIYR